MATPIFKSTRVLGFLTLTLILTLTPTPTPTFTIVIKWNAISYAPHFIRCDELLLYFVSKSPLLNFTLKLLDRNQALFLFPANLLLFCAIRVRLKVSSAF